jgi:hypothetical protein
VSWLITIYFFISFSSTPEPNTKQSRSVLLLFYNQIKNKAALFYLPNTKQSHFISESGAKSFHSLRFLNQMLYHRTLFIKHIAGMHSIVLSDPFQMLCAPMDGRLPLGWSIAVSLVMYLLWSFFVLSENDDAL